MKFTFTGARANQLPESGAVAPHVHAPTVVSIGDQGHAQVMVDHALAFGGWWIVSGWKVGDFRLELTAGQRKIPCEIHKTERADVSLHFPQAGEELGFVLIAQGLDIADAGLSWSVGGDQGIIALSFTDAAIAPGAVAQLPGAARALLARRFATGSRQWKTLTAAISEPTPQLACGYLESAIVPIAGDQVIVCGWVVAVPGAQFWLEDDSGNVYDLADASWRSRQDVMDSVGDRFGPQALNSGFVVQLKRVGAANGFLLKAMTSQGVYLLHEIERTQMPADPVVVSRWLFGIAVSDSELAEHHRKVEGPVLSRLIDHSHALWSELPVTIKQLGTGPAEPLASVIVPLYGRVDFIESQMLEWVRDPWLLDHVELIYVLDDPRLAAAFGSHLEELHRLYRVPMRSVWGGVNRGYSGANNLGAASARGDYLVFLNSDVFPQSPGWLPPLLEVLRTRPDIGAVGPRLVFAEGGIQHAGMRFERLEEYGVWINRHPCLGLDPELDPNHELALMPAITGACLTMRRCDFDAVGGWDSGYLIGDFEDSDLCLKLRNSGLSIAYLPTVQMVHLERQSMSGLGDGTYRTRVTLWNAMRHQQRWKTLIETPLEPRT